MHCGDFDIPDAWVVREGIAIQAKHRLVGLSLQLESLGVDISCLEIDLAIVELEGGDVAVSIDGNIVWMWWHKWIYHYSVEAAINLLRDLAEHNLYETLDYAKD